MARNFFRARFALLLLLAVTGSVCAYSQSQRAIQISNADAARGLRRGGELINRLIGNVVLFHNGTKMTCDSAYLYPDQRFEAFGRVRILKDQTTLHGQYLEYDSKTDEGRMTGKIVRMVDGKTTLKTPVILFNTSTNNASFDQGATVDNENIHLECQRGYYNSQTKVFVFHQQVQVKDKDYVIATDSMHYDHPRQISSFFKTTYIWHKDGFLSCRYGRMNSQTDDFYFSDRAYIQTKDQEIWSDKASYNKKTTVGVFEGNMQVLDTVQGICIFGNYAWFQQNHKVGFVTQKPVIGYFSNNPKEDTLFMAADTLRMVRYPGLEQDTSARIAKAYSNVRAYRNDLQWVCDSLNYASKDSLAELFVEPIIWSDQNQITADKIELYIQKKQLHRMEFTENVFISSIDDSIKKLYNQIKGKSATGFFKNNELYRYDIFGNSQSVYFMRDKNKLTGVNFSESSDMRIFLKNRTIQRINYLTKPESRMIPKKKMVEENLELKGFAWKDERRPKSKQEVCPYPRRHSQRLETQKLPKPTFPITERIKMLSR